MMLALLLRTRCDAGPIGPCRRWRLADQRFNFFQSTRDCAAATDGHVLVLHGTTEFSYQRDRPELIGITKRITNRKPDGNPRMYTACGILMRSSLAITTAGLPPGLSAVKFWTQTSSKEQRLSRENQSDAGSHREERKHSMAGEPKLK
jgi:hypothetical protein